MIHKVHRITFLHHIKNLGEAHKKNFIVSRIKALACDYGIENIWHFYEPYIEITWLNDNVKQNQQFINALWGVLESENIKDGTITLNAPDQWADWFCKNEHERYFGALIHSHCSKMATLFDVYSYHIRNGKGKKEQVKRTIHRLCNPLGLNYMEEAGICFSRGLICLLFCFFSFKKAVWIYTKIFRQKY